MLQVSSGACFFSHSCHTILSQKLHDWPNIGQMYKQIVADGEKKKKKIQRSNGSFSFVFHKHLIRTKRNPTRRSLGSLVVVQFWQKICSVVQDISGSHSYSSCQLAASARHCSSARESLNSMLPFSNTLAVLPISCNKEVRWVIVHLLRFCPPLLGALRVALINRFLTLCSFKPVKYCGISKNICSDGYSRFSWVFKSTTVSVFTVLEFLHIWCEGNILVEYS